MSETKKEWFDDWFESPWYLELYSHRTDEEASKAIELFRLKTQLTNGSSVLDLCCGTGRHARSLAEKGFNVTGVDYSHYFIDKATKENSLENLKFIHCDMRDEYPGKPYDAVVNFFTSFGYFEEDKENILVLKRVHDSLTSQGWFLFDYLNEYRVRQNLIKRSSKALLGATIIEEREIEDKYVVKKITIIQEKLLTIQYEERVKLYNMEDFEGLFASAELEIKECYGTYSADPFDKYSSPRLIILARRN